MNTGNFLKQLSWIVSGEVAAPFLKEIELSLHGTVRASNDYLPLVTGDVPTWVEAGISFATTETAFLDFNIPQDYDDGVDKIALRLHEVPSAAHATDTTLLGITTAQSIYGAGAAVVTTVSTAKAESATASVTTAKVRENVLDLSGRGYKAGDRIRLTLTCTATGGLELILLGMNLIYASCVRGYNDADRYRSLG
jgi:hypothetical protein